MCEFEMDTEKQRQHRHDDARLAESRDANQQRMTARRALEWIGTLKASWF